MSPTTYLVTGSSKGIGAEFVRQILANEPDAVVIGAARDPDGSDELQELRKQHGDRLKTVKLDVTDLEGIKAAAKTVEGLAPGGIDVLVSNAGTNAGNFGDSLDESVVEHLQTNLQTNVVGPVALVQALLPQLRKGNKRTIWVTSSDAASLTGSLAQKGSAATYSISKAALNMAFVKLARSLDDEKFTILLLHPGFVGTNFGGEEVKKEADISPEESVSKSLATLNSKGPADSGSFWSWDDKRMPW